MPFEKGNPRHINAGRKEGTPNKTIKQSILDTFAQLQARPGSSLTDWAEENLTDFYTKVVPKVIPLQAEVSVNQHTTIIDLSGKSPGIDAETGGSLPDILS